MFAFVFVFVVIVVVVVVVVVVAVIVSNGRTAQRVHRGQRHNVPVGRPSMGPHITRGPDARIFFLNSGLRGAIDT